MSKTFNINGHEVEFSTCTAIAISAGDTVRQDAIFVHDCTDEFGDGDGVVFGFPLPEAKEEANDLLCDPGYDTYHETLDTVILK